MHRTIGLLTILVGLCASLAVCAETARPAPIDNPAAQFSLAAGQITLAQALELAASNSPITRQSSAAVTEAAAKVRSARALQNPSLSVAHGAGSNTGGLDEDITLTQIVELGGKRAYGIRGANAELSAAQFERIGSALDLRLSVQTAYYEALRAQEEYDLAAASLDVIRQFAEAAKIQFQAGDAPRSNVLRSEIELSRAEQALAAAQTERENRLATLRSLTGLPPERALTLTDKLAFAPKTCLPTALETTALQSRPDLLAAQSAKDSLVAAVGSARAESRPDFFIEGRRASVDPAVDGASVRAGITLTPWDYGRKRSDVAAARAAVGRQDARIAEARRIALLEVGTACRNLEQARTTVNSFETGRLTRAKELLDMAQTGYQKGASTYLELLDAQNAYRNEQADYARGLADYNIALATLERAVGGKLP